MGEATGGDTRTLLIYFPNCYKSPVDETSGQQLTPLHQQRAPPFLFASFRGVPSGGLYQMKYSPSMPEHSEASYDFTSVMSEVSNLMSVQQSPIYRQPQQSYPKFNTMLDGGWGQTHLFSVDFPAPWPDLVSTRRRMGFGLFGSVW